MITKMLPQAPKYSLKASKMTILGIKKHPFQ